MACKKGGIHAIQDHGWQETTVSRFIEAETILGVIPEANKVF
jgi:hypothetical protein